MEQLARRSYLVDEEVISRRLGIEIQHPIRVFSLEKLGINQEKFLRDMAPTFSMLGWDQYDVKREQVAYLAARFSHEKDRLNLFMADYYKGEATLESVGDLVVELSQEGRWAFERIRPWRKRSICKFKLERKESNGWKIETVAPESYTQNAPSAKGDYRALARRFNETSKMVTEHAGFRKFLALVADMVHEIRRDADYIDISMHQVSTFAELEGNGDNSPEGIHQDGADFIVSALVVERDGIVGGESIVYGPDKKTEYLRYTLQPGQGIFMADKHTPLWHYVTPVKEDPNTPPTYGKRSIFGLDIEVSPPR